MQFFNLDLHIGVISDIGQIFRKLGHQVTNWTISDHAWVLGREIDKVDVVNQRNWRNIDGTMCDAFYERYKTELEQYDAFIVTHTPCFSMLYERWNKPVICVVSTRYEAPFSNNRFAWEAFNAFLRRQIDSEMIIPVANNKYDAAYAKYFTQRPWQTIPSLCEYTNSPYTGTRCESLYYSKFDCPVEIPALVNKRTLVRQGLAHRAMRRLGLRIGARGYSWQDLASFKSIVYMPYNASIMSIFELYASGIPMFFPSQKFAAELYVKYRNQGLFSELSYNQILGLPSRSVIPSDAFDPNDYANEEVLMHWIEKSDFYDAENLKHLIYFDSFDELKSLLNEVDTQEVSKRITEHQRERSTRSHAAWDALLKTLSGRLPQATNNSDNCPGR